MAIDTQALLDEFTRLANERRDLWHCFAIIPLDEAMFEPTPLIEKLVQNIAPENAVQLSVDKRFFGGFQAFSYYFSSSDSSAGALREFKQLTAACRGLDLKRFRDPERKLQRCIAYVGDHAVGEPKILERDNSHFHETNWLEHLYESFQPNSVDCTLPGETKPRYEAIALPLDVLRASVLALKTLLAGDGQEEQQYATHGDDVAAEYRRGGSIKGEVLTAAKVAEILGVSESTVSRNLEDRIPAGKGYLYSWRAVMKYAKENKKELD